MIFETIGIYVLAMCWMILENFDLELELNDLHGEAMKVEDGDRSREPYAFVP